MFKKTKVAGIPLTLDLARQFAGMKPVPGEREVRFARTEYLLTALRDGRFAGPCWARGIDRSTSLEYRLDGQHSSKVLAGLPPEIPFPDGLLVTMDTYEFDSIEDDGPPLFNLFNHPKSARTNEDAIGIFKARSPNLDEISRAFLLKLGAGIAEYQRGERARGVKSATVRAPRDRGLYFSGPEAKFEPFAIWALQFAETKNASFMKRPAIVAEMVSDWLASADVAAEFWNYALRENHPEVDHETRTMAETFRSWALQKKYKPEHFRARAKTAWKHYLRELRGGGLNANDRFTGRKREVSNAP